MSKWAVCALLVLVVDLHPLSSTTLNRFPANAPCQRSQSSTLSAPGADTLRQNGPTGGQDKVEGGAIRNEVVVAYLLPKKKLRMLEVFSL